MEVSLLSALAATLATAAIRALPRGAAGGWAWGPELGRALLCAAGSLPLHAWMARYHLAGAPVTASDFGEYCGGVVSLLTGEAQAWATNRSALAALPSAVGAAVFGGPLDGLQVGAAAGAAALGAGLYLWGAALHGPAAGLSAAIFAGSVAPLTGLFHTLSYYPAIVGGLSLGTGLALAGARAGGGAGMAAGGVALGLCLLIDVRGLLWALPLAVPLGLRALAAGRGAPSALLALALPVAASFAGGQVAFHPDTPRLEVQADARRFVQAAGFAPDGPQPRLTGREFLWGHSDPRDIPQSLLDLQRMNGELPAAWRAQPSLLHHRQERVDPWAGPAAAAGVAAALALAPQPAALGALLLSLAPHAASLKGAVEVQQSEARFLAGAAPGLAALLGVGFAGLAGARRGARAAATGALALLLTLGALPSPLSPVAGWRQPLRSQAIGVAQHLAAAEGRPTTSRVSPPCTRAIAAELRAGGPHLVDADALRAVALPAHDPNAHRPTGGGALQPRETP